MTAGLLKVKRVHPDARLPTYATAGAACFDLCAIEVGGASDAESRTLAKFGHEHETKVRVIAGQPHTFRTGLAFEVPEGWVMLIYSRSGHGFNNDIRLANCVGVIDSDYRGEVKVKLTSDNGYGLPIKNGDRIAQAMLVRADQWHLEEVDELSDTARGTGGFGSTGM